MVAPPITRIDVRKAIDVYRAGRSRNLPLAEKVRRAAREVEPAVPGFEPPSEAERRPLPCYGVPVPETLDFHRGAGTWRDRIAFGEPRSG